MASPAQESSLPRFSSALIFENIPPSPVACAFIEPSQVYEWLENLTVKNVHAQRDFLLVDVRRDDWVGGTIATSVNWPAQSFYQTMPAVYTLCKHAGIKKVIFYCGKYFIPRNPFVLYLEYSASR